MNKLVFPLAFVGAASVVACSFQMHAGTDPAKPPPPRPGTVATTPQPAPPAVSKGPVHKLGKRTSGNAGPTPAPTNSSTVAPPPPPAPGAGTVVTGATIFGSGTADVAGFKGAIYWVPATTTAIPAVASMTPAGYLFSPTLNVTPQTFTGGFPGVDPTHTTNFVIHYEAPLVVTAEADYDFRLVSEDGSNLAIDGTPIVNNDGVRAAPAEKSGPVHLVLGTHVISVDYLQTTGAVSLQLFCRKANDAEKVCPTQL